MFSPSSLVLETDDYILFKTRQVLGNMLLQAAGMCQGLCKVCDPFPTPTLILSLDGSSKWVPKAPRRKTLLCIDLAKTYALLRSYLAQTGHARSAIACMIEHKSSLIAW